MADKGKNDGFQEDEIFWLQAIMDVIPLIKNKKHEPEAALPENRKRKTGATPPSPQPEPATRSSDIDGRTDERLRKGKIPIEARLDLHGMTQMEAQVALQDFLRSSYESGKRCLLVITGKGRPGKEDTGVLRRNFPLWLSDSPNANIVLRHYPARPWHGGQGAFYVLIRRKRF